MLFVSEMKSTEKKLKEKINSPTLYNTYLRLSRKDHDLVELASILAAKDWCVERVSVLFARGRSGWLIVFPYVPLLSCDK